jgi:hypothetical protein
MRDIVYESYSAANYWNINDFMRQFDNAIKSCSSLASFNTRLIAWAREVLKIDTIVTNQSCVGVHAGKEELAIQLCQSLGCDTYLSGGGASTYNKPKYFEDAGIVLQYQKFKHPVYTQQWQGKFVENLSIIDLIFNAGAMAGDVIRAI